MKDSTVIKTITSATMPLSEVPDTMLAAQVVEFNKPYRIHTIPTPSNLGPHDLLLKVAVASYCHTDSMVQAGIMGTSLPCTASHEGAGVCVAVGSEISDFKPGDRVMAGLPRNRCGHCPDCLGPEEYRQYCPRIDGYCGVTLDGAFAEYMIVDGRESALVPEKVSFETAAPLACAGCTIFRAVLQTELKAGEILGLVGAGGGLGHLGVQFAKAMGLVVVGIDAREKALELAKENGADIVVDARGGKEKVVGEVQKVTNGYGVDAAITISDADGAAALACAITKMHGLMIQVAQVGSIVSTTSWQSCLIASCLQPPEVKIPFHELIFRDIRVKGSLICTRSEAQRMLQMVADHEIKVTTNLFFSLNEIPKLLDVVHTGKMVGKGICIVSEDEQTKVKRGKQGQV